MGPLTAALADTRIPHDSPHVDVYEAAGRRWSAQTHGSQVKVGKDRFQDNLAGFPAF